MFAAIFYPTFADRLVKIFFLKDPWITEKSQQ